MPLEPSPRRWIAILQLMRLPNVFTAVADVAMGYLVTHAGSLQQLPLLALLVGASCLLYVAGMVLNDVFDVEVDTRERPNRPIPSGRVPLSTATLLGWSLLGGGVLLGWLAGYAAGSWRPGIVATLLAICVVLYDWTLKRTPLAPLFMGACRTLNVLLGMSLVSSAWSPAEWVIALGVGMYIVGVTIFARTEATTSARARLAFGTWVAGVGIGLVASLPSFWLSQSRLQLQITEKRWELLFELIMILILWRFVIAIFKPTPDRVQRAVRNGVHAIIVLDAAVCVGFASAFWAFALLLLLLPTMLLTRWLKAT